VELPTEQRLAVIEQAAGRVIDLATPANLERQVPSCPDWTMLDLVRHLARVYNWAGTIVEGQLQEPPDREGLPRKPEDVTAVDWLSDRLDFVLAALRSTPSNALIWNFTSSSPATKAWWVRRQMNETIVHRIDAELAAGVPIEDVAPQVGADVTDELLMTLGFEAADAAGFDHSGDIWLHLHATDASDAEWTIDIGSKRFARAHMKGDVALRGPALALSRWITGRSGIEELETFGDAQAAEAWRATISF
jgi:uncharacterized protein (TIGR03083 family)